MTSRLLRFALAAISLLFAVRNAPAAGTAEEADRVVELPPMRVSASDFTIRFKHDAEKNVRSGSVTNVMRKTSAWKAGLREGDDLISINQTPIVEMTLEEIKAGQAALKAGANQTFVFEIHRGLFKAKPRSLTLTLTGPPNKSPNEQARSR